MTKRRRQTPRSTVDRPVAMKRRHSSTSTTLATMTSVSHTQPSAHGAQNIEASEKMADRAQMVTAAPISFWAKIDISSYSNSGLICGPARQPVARRLDILVLPLPARMPGPEVRQNLRSVSLSIASAVRAPTQTALG